MNMIERAKAWLDDPTAYTEELDATDIIRELLAEIERLRTTIDMFTRVFLNPPRREEQQ